MSPSISTTGLTCSILSSLTFGLIPWHVQFLEPLNGTLLFWNRILFSAITAFAALLILKKFDDFKCLLRQPKNLLWLAAGTCIIAGQWWLFVWAPLNDLTKELSLGYFLLPLTLVLTGRIAYGEKLRPLQIVGTMTAMAGVGHELYEFGGLSWVTMVVFTGYPFYFLIRRRVQVSSLVCFSFESLLMLPFAVFALTNNTPFLSALTVNPNLYWLLPGLGFICTAAMLLYVVASKALPVSLFGLLSYLEPTIIFAVAVLILKEPVSHSQWVTYSFIWLATAIVCIDSIRIIAAKPAVA